MASIIPYALGAGARQVAVQGVARSAYEAEQALLRARAAGKIGNWAARMMYNKAQNRRRKRYKRTRANQNPRQESRVDGAEVRSNESVSADTLVDKPLLRTIGIGLGDSSRTAKEIFVRGIRINYCFDLLAPIPATPATGGNPGPLFLRMVVAEDLYGMGDNSVYPTNVAFFSGFGTKKPLDFNSTEFIGNLCTKVQHPLNTTRWKIKASRRIELRQNYESEHVTKNGSLWVPVNERVRFITTDAGTWPKKDLHFLYFYENGAQLSGHFMNQQIRIQTYFADA